jgi:hypothetical protein
MRASALVIGRQPAESHPLLKPALVDQVLASVAQVDWTEILKLPGKPVLRSSEKIAMERPQIREAI